jgi:small subunit ribosomal protein S20
MAHHKSSKKRIRQESARRLRNRYYKKTTRNAIKKLRGTTDRNEATSVMPDIIAMIDKLAKKGRIHKNKAGNLKSGLMKKVNGLAAA